MARARKRKARTLRGGMVPDLRRDRPLRFQNWGSPLSDSDAEKLRAAIERRMNEELPTTTKGELTMYFLEVFEDGYRLPVGNPKGYETLEMAIVGARKHVDDALPKNTVQIFKQVGHCYLGGDGDVYDSIKGE